MLWIWRENRKVHLLQSSFQKSSLTRECHGLRIPSDLDIAATAWSPWTPTYTPPNLQIRFVLGNALCIFKGEWTTEQNLVDLGVGVEVSNRRVGTYAKGNYCCNRSELRTWNRHHWANWRVNLEKMYTSGVFGVSGHSDHLQGHWKDVLRSKIW